ncbi:hypothetical protein [Synechococcus sp. TAK9802]|uniref:hypothetical protein n=1 Tax=Synechococcus sp. TAK9802 TaxID=1442558 RepID=UPI001646A056|nr:hypothetical protein [Synechococcus sp. TAK9802]QNI60491.1 hypothetical protein SynTAK9802_00173 [Synechococcus sp. TAK9802]
MITLIAFADTSLRRSVHRFNKQAQNLGFFDNICIYSERDFSNLYKESPFPSKVDRGYGYWSWKSRIILDTMSNVSCKDIIVYVDIGCHFNPKGKNRFEEYLGLLKFSKTGILAFQATAPSLSNSPLIHDGRPLPDQSLYIWTKGDVFDFFGIRDDEKFTKSQIIGAGIIFIQKNEHSMSIIQEWDQLMHSYPWLINDLPSISPNFSGFQEHRHDQSLWSILCLKYSVSTVSAYEYWYPQSFNLSKSDWRVLAKMPILAKRDLNYGSIVAIALLFKKIKRRFFKILLCYAEKTKNIYFCN